MTILDYDFNLIYNDVINRKEELLGVFREKWLGHEITKY